MEGTGNGRAETPGGVVEMVVVEMVKVVAASRHGTLLDKLDT
jgi:hypothetical protein